MTNDVIEQLGAYGAHADHVAPALTLHEVEARAPETPSPVVGPWLLPSWAVATATAALVLVLIGGLAVMLGGSEGSAPPADDPTTTTASLSTQELAPNGNWNPILGSVSAQSVASMDACPIGSTPDVAGDPNQARPVAGAESMLGAVFDTAQGAVITVDSNGDTWTFDVCTNTWRDTGANAAAVGGPGVLDDTSFYVPPLIYDVDSDVTVALGFEDVWVFDSEGNSWTEQPDTRPDDLESLLSGAVYHDPSGLIVTTSRNVDPSDGLGSLDAWAYDVDSNTWTRIGTINHQAGQFDLLGYSASLDRFILTGWFDDASESVGSQTLLVDPATGAQTIIDTESPYLDLAGWPVGHHGVGNDTVYIQQVGWGLCRFNTEALAWTDCHDAPTTASRLADAIVADPINDRLLLLPTPLGPGATELWSVDPNTGQWTQLVSGGNGSSERAVPAQRIWVHPQHGIILQVSPSHVPAVEGTVEVTVSGYTTDEWVTAWVTACPGAKGVVDFEAWTEWERGITYACGIRSDPFESGQMVEAVLDDAHFETTLSVIIDRAAIEVGGVVIETGDIWVPAAGTVLLRVSDTDSPSTIEPSNLDRLFGDIRYRPPFLAAFAETYANIGNCTEAYTLAETGQASYLAALEEWNEPERSKPGIDYDNAVALLSASEQWLFDNECPGRYDFTPTS